MNHSLQKQMAGLAAGLLFGVLLAGCEQASAPSGAASSPAPVMTVVPAPALPTAGPTPPVSAAPTTVPTRAATAAAPVPASTSAAHLVTEDFEFTVPVSEDDLDPIVPAIRNLDGVTDVQAGGSGLVITYDPARSSHKLIVDTIGGYGFHVKP